MHCCQRMHDALVQDVAVIYISKYREYGIRILDGGTSFLEIEFCPWCGTRLPGSLRDAWFAEIERRGLEPDSEAIPPEYTTDAWWRT
jgi:hypothetical protein